ncbi:hypothetical protein NQ317_005318 [Molorchus minor]|uniref:Transposable element P transposase-like RNase H C-terminal domain-containing protein n=1 Tax=Molorchus minor TaxID=1323400 RepID=A0ABQ9K034_9CUCU|nr:hypothetical protein NQ317_005318 [Molorchus minor]
MCQKMGFKYLRTRSLNQDPIENLFAGIRQYGSTNTNPTCFQFISALKTSVLNSLIEPHARNQNCEQDNSTILDNLQSFINIGDIQTEVASCLEHNELTDIIPQFNGNLDGVDIQTTTYVAGFFDLGRSFSMKLDFKRGVLQINEEEVVLHGRTEERVRVVLAEDSFISERCEAILYACPDGRYDEGSIMMVEPGTHDSEGGHGVVIGKSLSHVRKIVPVRVMNMNYHPVTLKKGTVLGYCCPVASIVRSLGTTRENSAEISAELEALIKTSSIHLKMDQRKIEEQRDLFQVPAEFALAHCVAQDLQMSRGIAAAFKEKFGNVDELRRQRPEVGDVLQLGGDETSRRVFYLVTKHLSRDKPT